MYVLQINSQKVQLLIHIIRQKLLSSRKLIQCHIFLCLYMNCHCNATFLIDNYLIESTSVEDIYFLANNYLLQPILLEMAYYLTNDYLP